MGVVCTTTDEEGQLVTIAFLLTTLVVVATPGTGAVYSIAAGLSRGTRSGIIAAFGCTLGVIPHMIAAITGLAAILNASAIAFQTIKWLGVAYLLFLAWQTFRDKSAIRHRRGRRSRLVRGPSSAPPCSSTCSIRS